MTPDKKWMDLINDRLGEAYGQGIENFLDYAFERTGETNEIRCPCVKCANAHFGSREYVKMHLIVYGILQNYRFWYHHGEKPEDDLELHNSETEVDDNDYFMEDLLRDLHPHYDDSNHANISEEPNDEAKFFYRLLNVSKEPLYEGSRVSKLSALIKLLHLKNVGQWTNKSFSMLLQLLKEEILLENFDLPDSYFDAKKFIRDIDLSYEKIDACKNICMLFWKDHKNLDFCEVCGISRWKEERHSGGTQFKANGKKIPKKILRYFPLKPRLQRLFMCSKTAPYMRWHNDARIDDEILRHPADSMTWKSFDERYKDFSLEARNVRLGLASDGFQPFANAKTTYSIWPVILIPYNLPLSMCTNLSNFILSMLIPGPESSGDAIDIYLQPLIDELIELWHTGVETFDTSTSQNFTLRAALLWTINDFPAYAYLSGWSTKGKLACPCCNKDTYSMRLTNGGKECYMRH
ncbi:uncharacterized protein LOC122031244 [Zingiber officinale]|uniref:uncharacterized protein LOC122031244 n=1 Tax=Zingiber officinale TaxID=94328 RepID=UPI001C4B1B03|nr:uncharacterized protein LOC122031244 [Zingiber officinale]